MLFGHVIVIIAEKNGMKNRKRNILFYLIFMAPFIIMALGIDL